MRIRVRLPRPPAGWVHNHHGQIWTWTALVVWFALCVATSVAFVLWLGSL